MAKFIFRVFLAVILLFLSNRVNGKANFKDVEEKLKQLNKPAVKTIQSEDGDIIDCVEIYKQPAFDHPALRNHVIQMKPSFDLKELKINSKNESSKLTVFQTWQKSGSCPEGTAATLVTVGYNYIGAKADINVWNPNVESEDEFTTAQIWLKAGPGDNFESLESGWMVNPQLYGDKKTRFFAHWTKDSYKTTGCFDLHCSGFVQTSSKVAFGGALAPVSTEFGQQYYINVGIFMDPNTNNWWLKIKEDLIIGYWPASSLLFYLNHSSTIVSIVVNFQDPKNRFSFLKKRLRSTLSSLLIQFFRERKTMANFIFWVFLILVLSYLSNRLNGKATFKEIHADVDGKLKQLNKPAVKTIQSDDGDIIDCVNIYKQPTFDHPALRNHVIQMKPSFNFKEMEFNSKNWSSKLTVFQTWQKSGSCPKGTVPIRRIRREDLLRTKSVQQFGRKPQEVVLKSNTTIEHKDGRFPSINSNALAFPAVVNRSAAILVTVGANYTGAKANINVWNPNVESEDFTTAQVWLKAGPNDNFESIESGWTVNPQLYGDKKTRLFAHWTKDSYKTTGCFDLQCSGFIQTSSKIALGAAISPISMELGQQYYITIGIYMDENTNNWWLIFGNGIAVGYWPASTLNALKNSATMVEWGGQVYSSTVRKSPHTKTAMGSGKFASSLKGNACYMENIAIVDFSTQLQYPPEVTTLAEENYCYTALNHQDGSESSPTFYFGGPGQNYNCP
ncbi:uncharacterized protein LOC108468348 [Gossypium arboreum]|uniref:uncharacterized protein LOC108468348 n=1 Tax=Gossypium arboreum TaxID=29729 RepID=UPI0022F1C6AC|nr:uncharacterized protein LOC108468348 [Gossypium arboreum]